MNSFKKEKSHQYQLYNVLKTYLGLTFFKLIFWYFLQLL